MRVLMAIAVVLLATSVAEAQYRFEYDGRVIRIDPDRGTVSIPGVFDNTPKDNTKKAKRARTDQGRQRQPTNADPLAPEQAAPAASQPAPAAAAAPATPPPAASAATTNSTAPASVTPTETAAIPPASTPAPENPSPVQAQPAGAATTPDIAPPVTAAVPPAPPAVSKPAETVVTASPPPAAAPRDPHSPVGVWLTEEKEGKVRIEPCGANLCGYSVDAKSNDNAEQVLINMKPGKDQKWSGRILDPSTGSTYDSTIGLIGANALRVQGCAFGGMFCGGQTWTRVN
ncbi:MAG TPA: DUF2147 domain-containing protein [Bradyrhizobium sp.]|nr:DUF2147 domain-containing protein [Bradyrhizobium sp.]